MANRIVGSVLIVDSAMGNAFIIASANMSVQTTFYHTNAVVFWSADTTGRLIISAADTTNHIISMGWTVNGAGTGMNPSSQSTGFGQKQSLDSLKVPVLTAGTAWLYLC